MTDMEGRSLFSALRLRLGVWLLKPHWLPLLEQKNEAARTCGAGADEARRRDRLTCIVIGIKETIGVGATWSRR